MDYIKFLNDKVAEELEKGSKYQEAVATSNEINGTIAEIRKNFPAVFPEFKTFSDLVRDSGGFEQSYAERDDDLDKYQYEINSHFYDKEAQKDYSRRMAVAQEYYDQLGKFLEKFDAYKLQKMSDRLMQSSLDIERERVLATKRVIVNNIASPELATFIDNYLKGTLPAELGEHGNDLAAVVDTEFKTMQEENNKLSRTIQNKLEDYLEKE